MGRKATEGKEFEDIAMEHIDSLYSMAIRLCYLMKR